MKILVISDTHRKNENLFRVLEKTGTPDLLIHCGDVEGSEYTISQAAGCPVEMVAGNNDFFSTLPREREFTLAGHQILLTHGHSYYVSMGNEMIKQEAAARGADIVIYGHTHRPVIDISEEITALNPGSLSYPRQEGHLPSYLLMELDENGKAQFSIHFLHEND